MVSSSSIFKRSFKKEWEIFFKILESFMPSSFSVRTKLQCWHRSLNKTWCYSDMCIPLYLTIQFFVLYMISFVLYEIEHVEDMGQKTKAHAMKSTNKTCCRLCRKQRNTAVNSSPFVPKWILCTSHIVNA